LQTQQETPDGLDAWVRLTWPRAVVYARSLVRDRSAAEDIVQDCFCNLLRKADLYDLVRDGVPLLMKAITNACFSRNQRAKPMLSLHVPGLDPADETGTEPVKVVLHAELEQAIAAALAELPDLQRAAIELKGLGHSLREIAEILDVSSANAGVLIHRGRQELAERLGPYLGTKSDERKAE
jgi:RNA polymerase sigma-70 factor (ECF subfamily)